MAAGRISVRLGATSWPPGRGGTAGQSPAPRGGGWGQRRRGPWCAWPGLPVLAGAGDPVEVQEGGCCCCSACSAPAAPCELHAGSACAACSHPALSAPMHRGVSRALGAPTSSTPELALSNPFSDGCGSHILRRGPASVKEGPEQGGTGVWAGRRCKGCGQRQWQARLSMQSSWVSREERDGAHIAHRATLQSVVTRTGNGEQGTGFLLGCVQMLCTFQCCRAVQQVRADCWE